MQEQEQLQAIRDSLKKDDAKDVEPSKQDIDRDFEGGYGGQEDLEDRYATTYGMH